MDAKNKEYSNLSAPSPFRRENILAIIDSHHKFKSAHGEVRELLDKKAKKI